MQRSSMQIYVKNSIQAMKFYQDLFGAKEICCYLNKDKNTVEHAELDMFGQILAIAETDHEQIISGNSMQFNLRFSENERSIVQKIIDGLCDGGTVLCDNVDWSPLLISVIDKFGVSWLIFIC